jgi:fumarylacetoacetase
MHQLNQTHDPHRHSWVAESDGNTGDFPIQNLPFGIFQRPDGEPCGGVAIHNHIFDLREGLNAGLFSDLAQTAAEAAAGPTLNRLMALGNAPASALRARLSDLLRIDGPERDKMIAQRKRLLVPMSDVGLLLPCHIGAFTDFFTSIFHATRGGRQRNPDQPLPVNFKYVPIGYNARASSVRVSGASFRRPNGQYKHPDGGIRFGPEPRLDFELEVGAFIGRGNALGAPIPLARSRDHIFGYCLLNDWSARSIQAWETVPAGPFQGKTFCTTISPWIVTGEALAPFQCAAFKRAADDPAPLGYLVDPGNEKDGGLDLRLEAYIATPRMRDRGLSPARISLTNLTTLYWTFGQMLTYHASNGTDLSAGDLLGSGTASGETDESRGCMNELSDYGRADIPLPGGETRRYLEDGDDIIFRAKAEREGFISIGFGECRGRVEPAVTWPSGDAR